MDIVTLAAARKGSGGGASKEYVDEKVAALIDDTTAAQNKAYSSAKVEEKVAGEEITTTATGSDITLSTSSGNVNALTVYGKSEVVDGAIVSAGEGYAVVDLGTLTWTYITGFTSPAFNTPINQINAIPNSIDLICPLYQPETAFWDKQNQDMKIATGGTGLNISNSNYTNASAFKAAMSGVLLCYKLANPTQGNTIAVKTDDGTGINGTMATFSTGTPLRGIPNGAKDVAEWNGSSGEVVTRCGDIDLSQLTWNYTTVFIATLPFTLTKRGAMALMPNYLCVEEMSSAEMPDKSFQLVKTSTDNLIWIKDAAYNNLTDFTNSLSGVHLVYELATPTTEQLTTTENNSIAGLRTFEPMTHAQNNAGATMTVEAYAGTANGKAVNELKQDVQSEISALKITQSGTLTLTVAGWTNNTQTVTYAHDTAKRNVIDVDPSSVEEWANCGILATAETASGITFTCKTVPTNALTFRVTSMEV